MGNYFATSVLTLSRVLELVRRDSDRNCWWGDCDSKLPGIMSKVGDSCTRFTLSDLFSPRSPDLLHYQTSATQAPLAEQLRPQTPDEVIGQQPLLGAGKPLRLAFESGQPHSMILWGPPGVGKTTLARMMATQFNCEFIALSAVFSGIKEVREAVVQAELWRAQGKRTILFVDEIHRFNKALKVMQVIDY